MELKFISRFYKDILIPDLKAWIKETGIKIYIVGGACRDSIRCGETRTTVIPDVDFCVESPEGAKPVITYLSDLKDDSGKNKYEVKIVNSFDSIGTIIVEIKEGLRHLNKVEFAMTRREIYEKAVRRPSKVEFASIQDDALRRDFCCNAVYYDIEKDTYLDPTGKGIHDAKQGILRSIKDPETSFREDPLRMIRCIRFWHTKKLEGYTIEENTEKALHWYPEFDQVSLDLIRPEVETLITWAIRTADICSDRKSSNVIRFIHSRGLLKHIIPELEEAWGFNQNSPHHSMNLSDHLLSTLDWAQIMSMERNHYLAIDEVILAWSCLLHDISKYQGYQLKQDNTFSYHGHEIESGEMAEKILLRLGYDKKFSENVKKIIQCHMYLKPLWDEKAKVYDAKDKVTRRVWKKISDTNFREEVLLLIDADNNTHAPNSCRPNQVKQFRERHEILEPSVLKKATGKRDRDIILPDGEMIRDALGISKEDSELIGQVKSALNQVLPDIVGYSSMSPEELLSAYLSIFDQTFYVRKVKRFGDQSSYDYELYEGNPFSAKDRWNIDIVNKFDIRRVEKCFADGKDLINADDLRKEIQGAIIQTADTHVLKINTIYYPNLYLKFQTYKQVHLSYNREISRGLRDITSLPGFSKIDINYQDGDATAVVEFEDGYRIVIM